MALFFWCIVVVFYTSVGLFYLTFSNLDPLGAMAMNGAAYDIAQTIFIGCCGVFLGYWLFSRTRLPKTSFLTDKSFLRFCAFGYFGVALLTFTLGVQYYGGYFSFLSTPYSAIYAGSAENEIKDVLISSSGLLSIFAILCFYSSGRINYLAKPFLALAFIILLSIFIQGRRETLLLLIMCVLSYMFLGKKIRLMNLLKVLIIVMFLLIVAGAGLYIRASSSTSGGGVFSAVGYAVLYETHFTIANLENEIKSHAYNGQPFGGAFELLYPFLFIVPSLLFSIFGINKGDFFSSSEARIYDDKGGEFVFTEGYHAMGEVGVFIHGIILGAMLILFYRLTRKSQMVLYHFPIVALILVASRKDLTYGVKYISLLFIFMLVFRIIYVVLPKKRSGM
jgi:oligosaccharide repeat unit polymerase